MALATAMWFGLPSEVESAIVSEPALAPKRERRALACRYGESGRATKAMYSV